MRKMTALLMALLMTMMCVPAFAETAPAETKEYTHPTAGYTLTVPEGWLLVDASNLDEFIAGCKNGEIRYLGDVSDKNELFLRVNSSTVILVDPNGCYVMVSGGDTGVERDSASFKSLTLPGIVDFLPLFYTDLQIKTKGKICTYGNNEFVRLTYTYQDNGVAKMQDTLFLMRGSLRYDVSLISPVLPAQETVDQFYAEAEKMLNTFTVPAV